MKERETERQEMKERGRKARDEREGETERQEMKEKDRSQ